MWSWDVDTNEVSMDGRAHALWGVPWGEPLTLEALSSRIHPPDLLEVQTVLEATRTKPGPYEVAFRILGGGEVRSVAGGTLDVSCSDSDGEVAIVWTERGGPPVTAPTGPGGFGSKLIAQSLSGALGGAIAFAWPPEGAVVTLRMRKARLAL